MSSGRETTSPLAAAYPDYKEEVLDIVPEGDMVVTRFLSTGTQKAIAKRSFKIRNLTPADYRSCHAFILAYCRDRSDVAFGSGHRTHFGTLLPYATAIAMNEDPKGETQVLGQNRLLTAPHVGPRIGFWQGILDI